MQSAVVPSDPQLALTQYIGDPGGRFGQYVPKAFWDYLNGLPLPWQSVMGFPISPPFGTQLVVGGVARPVFVQAFERRVLTYTPGNPAGFAVEFGNIGQHYYQWRYGQPVPAPRSRSPATAAPGRHRSWITGASPAFATGVNNLVAKNSSALPLGNATGTAYDETLLVPAVREWGDVLRQEFGRHLRAEQDRRATHRLSRTPGMMATRTAISPLARARKRTSPKRGFGKVWRENAVVQQALGYATSDETSSTTARCNFSIAACSSTIPTNGLVWALNTAIGIWDSAAR